MQEPKRADLADLVGARQVIRGAAGFVRCDQLGNDVSGEPITEAIRWPRWFRLMRDRLVTLLVKRLVQ